MARGPDNRDRRDRRDRNNDDRGDSDIVEKLVHINRVAATVKGGRRFSFAALMVVGDQKGRVGYGHGKAREVPEAIRKATEEAKKSMIRVPLRESRTLHHDGHGRWGAGKIMMRAAPPGTGIIAGGPMRAVLEALGVQDVVGKSDGLVQPLQHGARHLRGAEGTGLAAPGRRQARQEGRRHHRPPRRRRRRRGGGVRRWPRSPSARPAARSAAPRTSAPRWSAWASTSSAAPSTLEDTPSVRGMIAKVAHMVEVVE